MSEIQLAAPDLTALFAGPHAADSLILNHLQDAVVICDAEGRIVYINAAFQRLFEWTSEETLGQHVTFRYPERLRPVIDGYMAEIIGGHAFARDFEDFRADGSRIWVHWRAKRVRNAAGHVIGTFNVGTDISDRKRAEAAREQLQQQLYQAQKLETLGTLAGGIAHDFNNILAVILGFTELALARQNGDEALKHMHEQVVVATRRGRDLVSRILSFSRFHQPERRPTDLTEVINDAAKFIRATLPTTVDLVTKLPPSPPPTLADPHQLHQVLLNLATNAQHAIRDHHGTLTLELSTTRLGAPINVASGPLPSGLYLIVTAADTGCGMDEPTLQRIFEPFFTTKAEGEGTGLGLSVVRAIVDGHGGAIDVVSAPGRGSTFKIYLPVVSGITLPIDATADDFTPRLRARGETIAVIDDEAAMVSVTERVLQSFGYSTVTFSSAEKFHAAFLTAPAGIHLLVTDQTMPGMTGMELARRLRDGGHDLPILLMTGFSKQLRREAVQQLGRANLLRKPYDRMMLGRAVRDLLDGIVPAA